MERYYRLMPFQFLRLSCRRRRRSGDTSVLPSHRPQSADNRSLQQQPSHRNYAIEGEMGAGYEMWEEVEILGVGKALDDLDVSLESSSGSSNPSA